MPIPGQQFFDFGNGRFGDAGEDLFGDAIAPIEHGAVVGSTILPCSLYSSSIAYFLPHISPRVASWKQKPLPHGPLPHGVPTRSVAGSQWPPVAVTLPPLAAPLIRRQYSRPQKWPWAARSMRFATPPTSKSRRR